jgi:hypothetical protein
LILLQSCILLGLLVLLWWGLAFLFSLFPYLFFNYLDVLTFIWIIYVYFLNLWMIRRAKAEMVTDRAWMAKDLWDRFSALLSMRRNQKLSCKVLLTSLWKVYLTCMSLGLHMITQIAPL